MLVSGESGRGKEANGAEGERERWGKRCKWRRSEVGVERCARGDRRGESDAIREKRMIVDKIQKGYNSYLVYATNMW
jgi:hypothetical protein